MSINEIMLPVQDAAVLLGISRQAITKHIHSGKYSAITEKWDAGQNGMRYLIPLSELPKEAQSAYLYSKAMRELEGGSYSFDLVGYVKSNPAKLDELLSFQKAVFAAHTIRQSTDRNKTEQLRALAAEYGISERTLYRWEKQYQEAGLGGYARKGRSDKGVSRAMCSESVRYIRELYLQPQRRAQAQILDKLIDRAAIMGLKACAECPFNPLSKNHAAIQGTQDAPFYPACNQTGGGIITPGSRHAVNEVIRQIPPEIITYMRKGRKAWEAAYMVKTDREKPKMVNQAWYGDHHQFDVFCIDEEGKLCRPWLTAWYDIGSGMPVGWCISKNPNGETIVEALARGIAVKKNSPIHGAPQYLYMDNGKDYRGKLLEGDRVRNYSLGTLNASLNKTGILNILCIEDKHALPYHGWAKPVERWFRSLEERYCIDLPGYCGGSPEKREENFMRKLRLLHERGELLTLDELSDVFLNQIIPAYANRPHDGYGGKTPMELYMSLPKARNEIIDWRTLSIIKSEMVERAVSTQGIMFEKVRYWHDDLRHIVGQRVILRYNRGDKRSLTVCDMDGRFVCEVEPKEYLQHVGENEEAIQRHIALQKRQEGEIRRTIQSYGVKLPGKRASGNMFYELVDEKARGNLTDMEAVTSPTLATSPARTLTPTQPRRAAARTSPATAPSCTALSQGTRRMTAPAAACTSAARPRWRAHILAATPPRRTAAACTPARASR